MMKDKINPFTLSLYVAPFINAITRSGSDDEKILVFESLYPVTEDFLKVGVHNTNLR